ncbi:Bug family tripartite tricarboxylate transporter substrate binding protein [Rubrivivax gelatinosus]|uniref:Bug family tripartite tricarboxylate transporter substrate binding protein n=1 Tax=Rubrivivax gelatinosus TaxID=28068 RepID=UPI003A808A54
MSSPNRRRALQTLAATALGPWLATPARAEGRTIRLLVGFPPGGGTDAIARVLAERLKDELGATVIVDNRPGAGGQLAAQALKAAAPDGTTFLLSHDHTISILPLVVRQPGYEPARDFVPVAGFASFPNAFAVSAHTPARTLGEYVAWVRAQGGQEAVGIPAAGSVPEFLVRLVAQRHGLDLVALPYRGSAPMMSDMLGRQIAAGVGSVPDFIDNHRHGRLRIVAVMGTQRLAQLPEVATLAESGVPGFEELLYYGVFAPAGTAAATIDAFGNALARVLVQPAVHERLSAMGLSVGYTSAAQLGARERAYTAAWARIIKASGLPPP